ncbi:MAG: hypothetical protein IPJ41_16645 [Phycisphaerales bacterium]|nr:hypothetical protein [Phycisphaerales bacterium]
MKTTHLTAILAAPLLATGALGGDTGTALERELLSDAGARASFQGGATAGHDGKFFMASPDGAFRLNVGGLVQFRYNMNFRDTTAPDEDFTNGFNTRRTKLILDGSVYDSIDFYVQAAFATSGGTMTLDQAYGSYKFENGMAVRWGQFKLPFLHEELTSDKYQLAAERSLVNKVFTQDYSQGVQLSYEGDRFRVMGAVSDGFSSLNTAYYSPSEADFAITARAEMRLGDASWKTYGDYTSFRGGDTGALVGAAVHWESFGDTGNTTTFGGTPATGMDMLSYTLDASYEGGGWNLGGAFVGRNIDPDGGTSADDFGALVQGGVFVSEKTELFARWDAIFPDSSYAAGNDFNTLTFGGNYYFIPGSHAAKFTADVQWYLDDQAGSGSVVKSNEGIGLAPASTDDQFAIRLQMQMIF